MRFCVLFAHFVDEVEIADDVFILHIDLDLCLPGVFLRLSEQLVQLRAESAPFREGHICLFEADLSEAAIRELVNRLTERCTGAVAVYWGSDEAGYRYIIGSRTQDVRETQKKLREKLGAKGGGKPAMVQGAVSGTKASVEDVLLS